jgi:hypothetical protein
MTRNPVQDGDFVLAPLFGSLINAHGAEGVLNGIDPSVGTGDWDVDTSAGDVFINNSTQAVSPTTTTLTDPASDADLDSGEFRVDLLTADSTGSINVAEGVAATEPITEDIPSDEAVVCAVVVSGAASSLQSADIYDYRTLIEDDAGRYIDGGPHEIDAAEFSGGSGLNNQALVSDGSSASWGTVFQQLSHTFHTNDTLGGISGATFAEVSNTVRAKNIDWSPYTTGTFEVQVDPSNSGSNETAECRVQAVGSGDTIAQVSTTGQTLVRLTDASAVPPDATSDAQVQLRNLSGNDAFMKNAVLTVRS